MELNAIFPVSHLGGLSAKLTEGLSYLKCGMSSNLASLTL